jgi:hypothetical protein
VRTVRRAILRWGVCAAAAIGVLGVAGCATGPAKETVTPTPIVTARNQVPEATLLDVGIHVLKVPKADGDAGEKESGASNPEVRAAEARFIPFVLKETLQRTGYWGAVRVVPDQAEEVDVSVKGTLVESNGETLTVEFRVADVSGRLWFDKEYSAVATRNSYDALKEKDHDPYQDLYNQVANDMLAYLQKLTPQDIATIRRISLLKFAKSIAPFAFAGYLTQDKSGITEVVRMPADNDPMLQRVERIREREFMFIDTVNQYYGNLYNDMREPYGQWRKSYLDEVTQQRALERQAWGRRILGVAAIVGAALVGFNFGDTAGGAAAATLMTIGGVEAFRSGSQYAEDAKIHEDAIKELGASFKGDVAPIVDEVDGHTVKLSGSVETQYAEWRKTLRELFAAETGQSPDAAASAAKASGTGDSGH